MKSKKKLLSAILAVVMLIGLLPATVFAASDSTLTVNAPDEFTVGEAVEFTVATTGGSKDGTMVYAEFEYDKTAVEKVEYYETAGSGANTWMELKGNTFGPPETGYPLTDATSRFRVTFKTEGEQTVKIAVKEFKSDAVIMEKNVTFKSVVAPTLTVNAPKEFTVGEAVEFTVATTGGSKAGTMVYAEFEYDKTAVEKVEYYETAGSGANTWMELKGNKFGPVATGFPLTDATSRFCVTFKTEGEQTVKIAIKEFKGDAVIMTETMQFKAVHVHKAAKTDAKDPTCTEAGNIEYWYCDGCGKYFSDEKCTKEITLADTVIKATGHKADKTDAKDPTCTEDGNTEYWYCAECAKYFSDEKCTKEITLADTVIKATGHKADKTDAKDPNCTEDGNTEYWHCTKCGKYFSDEKCTKEITLADTVIKATGHEAVKTEAKDPTCTEDGNTEYWYCAECDKYFSDADCKTEITLADTVIKATGHKAVKTEAKDPTCTEDGNTEYWHCTECGKYFSDEKCTKEITLADTVIKATAHKTVKTEAKDPTATEAGNIEYWYCAECGKYFSDKGLTKEITLKDTVVPATGSGTTEEPTTPTTPEKPAAPQTPSDIPDTGDSSTMMLIVLLALASCGIGTMVVCSRKKKVR